MQMPLSPPEGTPIGPPWTAKEWGDFLTKATDNPVRVTFGRARRQVIQSKGYWDDPTGKPIELRDKDQFCILKPVHTSASAV